MTNTAPKTAPKVYLQNQQEAVANLRRLLEHAEKMVNLQNPDWGDAGDADQLNRDIKHIAQRTFREGEFTA